MPDLAEAASGPRAEPVARGPVNPREPTRVVGGWLVSARRPEPDPPLVLVDATPVTKLLVRGPVTGAVAGHFDVAHRHCRRDGEGRLVVGSGPGEWLLLGPPGPAVPEEAVSAVVTVGGAGTTAIDVTHGRVLFRLTGAPATDALPHVCALDLSTSAFPDGSAARSAVAGVVTEVVRDDRDGTPSFLLSCETSSGRYLFDQVLDAGTLCGIEVAGFAHDPRP